MEVRHKYQVIPQCSLSVVCLFLYLYLCACIVLRFLLLFIYFVIYIYIYIYIYHCLWPNLWLFYYYYYYYYYCVCISFFVALSIWYCFFSTADGPLVSFFSYCSFLPSFIPFLCISLNRIYLLILFVCCLPVRLLLCLPCCLQILVSLFLLHTSWHSGHHCAWDPRGWQHQRDPLPHGGTVGRNLRGPWVPNDDGQNFRWRFHQ